MFLIASKHEAGAEHAHLAAGVHERGAVGQEPSADDQVEEAAGPRGALGLVAVAQLRPGNRLRHAGEQLPGGLDQRPLLVLLEVPGSKHAQGVLRQSQVVVRVDSSILDHIDHRKLPNWMPRKTERADCAPCHPCL